METLQAYVSRQLDKYDDNKKCTIKCVLKYLNADHILVSDYCEIYMKEDLASINPKDLIKHMVLHSPWGYNYSEEYKEKNKSSNKKIVLSFNEELEKDEIFNA